MSGIVLMFGDRAVTCTAFNSMVYTFPPPLDSRNHIFVQPDSDESSGFYVFGRPDVVRAFKVSGMFPILWMPYVSDDDEAVYQRWLAGERFDGKPKNALTEDEIARFAEEVSRDGVIGHWGELESEE